MKKRKWYNSIWLIVVLSALSPFAIATPLLLIFPIIAIALAILNNKMQKDTDAKIEELTNTIQRYKSNGIDEYEELAKRIKKESFDFDEKEFIYHQELLDLNEQINDRKSSLESLSASIDQLTSNNSKLETQIRNQKAKLSSIKELYASLDHAVKNFFDYVPSNSQFFIPENDLERAEQIAPSVILKLHSMDVKNLNKAYKENDKQITTILEQYSSRYTSKTNAAIYQLMVVALRSELQNILINLKYEQLDNAVNQVKTITTKYLKIAGEGNQSIAGTLTKFIGEIEYLFINAVKIEYNYYIKKEQAKQEQAAIREQMRQETAERKALEMERKKIENEEEKFNTEISKLQEQAKTAAESDIKALETRILELQAKLSDVTVKKDEIVNLQNGKAGNIYVISNLGSFGKNIFKIGMTRRLQPQDRVDELGSASVPFKFDVHSFIFSDDAVNLENKLHKMLDNKRVNKVNLRKEFFYSTVEELEELVNQVDPTAEFTKTMIAEEFRQSLSSDENYTNQFGDSEIIEN